MDENDRGHGKPRPPEPVHIARGAQQGLRRSEKPPPPEQPIEGLNTESRNQR